MSGATRDGGSILFISNGHGEDVIAVALIEALAGLGGPRALALPLVGMGHAYSGAGVEVVGPTQTLPSGGFARQSLANLVRDLGGGLLSLHARQSMALRHLRSVTSLAVCVGDMLPLLLAGLFLRRASILVATAKSDYYTLGKPHHLPIEAGLMRRLALRVYARDDMTGASLRVMGVNASWAGNVMMDCLGVTDEAISVDEGVTPIGLLPGSREESYGNLTQVLAMARLLPGLSPDRGRYCLLVAAAPTLSMVELAHVLQQEGFAPAAAEGSGPRLTGRSPEGVEARVYAGRLGDVVAASALVVGLSGTGNEQAAGLGKPVVSFAGRGSQFTRRFAEDQTRLLGEAVSLVESAPGVICSEVLSILGDPRRRARMGEVGRQRMGPPGAARRIAEGILEELGRID